MSEYHIRGESQIENSDLNVEARFVRRGYIVGTSRLHV